MIPNYTLLAVRNLLKQRSYTLVNIFGLAIGLGAAICILLMLKMNSASTVCTLRQKVSIESGSGAQWGS